MKIKIIAAILLSIIFLPQSVYAAACIRGTIQQLTFDRNSFDNVEPAGFALKISGSPNIYYFDTAQIGDINNSIRAQITYSTARAAYFLGSEVVIDHFNATTNCLWNGTFKFTTISLVKQ